MNRPRPCPSCDQTRTMAFVTRRTLFGVEEMCPMCAEKHDKEPKPRELLKEAEPDRFAWDRQEEST